MSTTVFTLLVLGATNVVLAFTCILLEKRVRRLEENQRRSHARLSEELAMQASINSRRFKSITRLAMAIADYVLPAELRNKLPREGLE